MQKIITFDSRIYQMGELSEQDVVYLERTIELARNAKAAGNYPFGALLVDAQGQILIEVENRQVASPDCTGHAETSVARTASKKYAASYLKTCTLYSSCEPCAMCAGAIYWSNIGRLVYACSEAALKTSTGSDPRNPTLDLPCRAVFACGQKEIEVIGPVEGLEDRYLQLHQNFWNSDG